MRRVASTQSSSGMAMSMMTMFGRRRAPRQPPRDRYPQPHHLHVPASRAPEDRRGRRVIVGEQYVTVMSTSPFEVVLNEHLEPVLRPHSGRTGPDGLARSA